MTVPEMSGHDCPADAQIVADLRELSTPALGRLAQPLLEAAQCGDAGPATMHALQVIGVVLSERKDRAA